MILQDLAATELDEAFDHIDVVVKTGVKPNPMRQEILNYMKQSIYSQFVSTITKTHLIYSFILVFETQYGINTSCIVPYYYFCLTLSITPF